MKVYDWNAESKTILKLAIDIKYYQNIFIEALLFDSMKKSIHLKNVYEYEIQFFLN